MIRENATTKKRARSQVLQASVSMFTVKVHDSTIRKRAYEYGLLERVAGESLFSRKTTWQHSVYKVASETNHFWTSEVMLFGQMIPKRRILVLMHSIMFGENHLGLFCSHRNWAPCSH